MLAGRALYRAETIVVGAEHWRELDRLSREADPDSQAALDRFLDRYGRVVSRVSARNLVTTAGKNYTGEGAFRGGGVSTWFVGLKGSGTPVAGDTMASHATWSEITAYSQSTRPALTLVAFASGSSNNSAARATFTANASTTIFGYFLASNSAKGGTTGTLYSVANFGASRSLTSGQSERVQVTITYS